MQGGLQEVLPKSVLASLTAEDFRLMLCGCPHIDVDILRAITVFDDESRKCLCTVGSLLVCHCLVLSLFTSTAPLLD